MGSAWKQVSRSARESASSAGHARDRPCRRCRARWQQAAREASTIEIDLAEPDAGERTPVGQILEPRQRRRLIRSAPLSGARPTAIFRAGSKRSVSTSSQSLVAGGDHEHARHCHLGVAVTNTGRITIVTQRRVMTSASLSGLQSRAARSGRRRRTTALHPNVAVSGLVATGERPGKIA